MLDPPDEWNTPGMEHDVDARLSRLEAAVRRLEADLANRTAPWPPPLAQPEGAPVATSGPDATVHRPDTEDVLKWVGVGLVVLAAGFVASTAVRRGWIGPELQLAAALCGTLSMSVVGVALRPKRPAWTTALCTGGTFATFVVISSDLFSEVAHPEIALGSTVIVGVGGYLLADRIDAEWVASTTVAGWVAAWFTIESTTTGPTDAAIASIVGGILIAGVLAHRRSWAVSRTVTYVVGMLAGLRLADDVTRGWQQVAVLSATTVLAVVIPWRARRSVEGIPHGRIDRCTSLLPVVVPAWHLATTSIAFDLDADPPIGAVAFAVTAGSLGLLAATHRRLGAARTTALLAGAGVTCSIGTTLVMPASTALAVVAAQAAALITLATHARAESVLGNRTPLVAEAAALGLITLVIVLVRTAAAWTSDATLLDDLGHLGAVLALAAGVRATRRPDARRVAAIGATALILIWLGSVLVHLPQGQAIVSVTWAAAGIGALGLGAVHKLPAAGSTGLAVLAITVGKLLTVDLAEVDALWRAALFLVVGLGMLRLAYVLPRLTGDRQGDRR